MFQNLLLRENRVHNGPWKTIVCYWFCIFSVLGFLHHVQFAIVQVWLSTSNIFSFLSLWSLKNKATSILSLLRLSFLVSMSPYRSVPTFDCIGKEKYCPIFTVVWWFLLIDISVWKFHLVPIVLYEGWTEHNVILGGRMIMPSSERWIQLFRLAAMHAYHIVTL